MIGDHFNLMVLFHYFKCYFFLVLDQLLLSLLAILNLLRLLGGQSLGDLLLLDGSVFQLLRF